MTRAPAIALQRQEEAIAKIAFKLSVLDGLIARNELGVFPRNVSIASFAKWDDRELGVSCPSSEHLALVL